MVSDSSIHFSQELPLLCACRRKYLSVASRAQTEARHSPLVTNLSSPPSRLRRVVPAVAIVPVPAAASNTVPAWFPSYRRLLRPAFARVASSRPIPHRVGVLISETDLIISLICNLILPLGLTPSTHTRVPSHPHYNGAR